MRFVPVRTDTTPLWPLPLLIAALFLVGVHAAWLLSMRDGLIPACLPYVDGCVSISRAARHGWGNHLFKLVALPCAVLHLLAWWLARRWLAPEAGRAVRLMLALGALSALALAVYATFLGSEGEVYRFLRRYGVVVYFGCGFVAQLLLMRQAVATARMGTRLHQAMALAAAVMLALGLVNVAAGLVGIDAGLQDRIENASEWLLGLMLVAWYVLLALAWRRDGFAMALSRG
ncbi:hypothetical protein [Pseudoxanthomonas mexicana]|uniref:hypothetical protein n=1 Tax=Pseudoxanthomonas mexicana TaxID=128785 RepID=UPI00398AE051